ncbi:MAG: ABC transporter ATP-binding protein [Gammaproteobacteria bacterium]|nr:MAG: ABC transporter ATP-binding protein [Gammaproteobacteria bacterium]
MNATAPPVTLVSHELSKRFGDMVAVNKVNLSIHQGEIFGLLGPNAAGKSTTIRMLAGIIRPSSGSAAILGLDLLRDTEQIKQHIGYVAQHFGLYPELTVKENLSFYASLYGSHSSLTDLLEQYELAAFSRKRAGELSGGFKRRLSIACALSHDPALVFLDEPTAGIDPVTRKELWDVFYDLAAAGKTLFVTTHYMEEAERCDSLAFLSQGRIVAQGSPQQIRARPGDYRVWQTDAPHSPELTRALQTLPCVETLNRFGSSLRIITDAGCDSDTLRNTIRQHSPKPAAVEPTAFNLEDVFITLTREHKS